MGLDMNLYAEKYVSAYDYEMTDDKMERSDNPIHALLIGISDMQTLPSAEYGGVIITKAVGYWRKANAIHGWFVRELADGVDECQRINVERSDLVKLRDLCVNELYNRATAKPTDESDYLINFDGSASGDETEVHAMIMEAFTREKAKTSVVDTSDPLAPMAGFFFGSTDKDEWYYDQLEYTVDMINSLLANDQDHELSYYYRASW